VLANGTIVNASTTVNPDLFWVRFHLEPCSTLRLIIYSQALRGAGPSFGLVTAWTFQTYPAPESVIDFTINFGSLTADEFTEALISFENFGATAPFEISIQAVLGPSGSGVSLSFQGDYYGSFADFHSVVNTWMQSLPGSPILEAKQLDWLDALISKDGSLSTSSPEKVSQDSLRFKH
jgi:hypothetical protein